MVFFAGHGVNDREYFFLPYNANLARPVVVFSAAQGRGLSQEREEWGHGAFTKVLLEALQGGAANGNGEITINDLDTYLANHVSTLTNGAQTPIQTRPPGVPSFTFMRVAKPRLPAG